MRVLSCLEPTLLALGVGLLPLYVFGSGGVQPAHMVLAGFFAISIVRNGVSLTSWTLLLGAVFAHSLLVESTYALMLHDPSHLIHSAFFLYNFLLSAAVYDFVRRHGLGAVSLGLTCAALLAVFTVLVSGDDLQEIQDVARATGTFNNPNQLGYFSVCLLSLAYLCYRHGVFGYKLAASLFVAALFLSISSLSKAAMLANFSVMLLALRPTSSRYSEAQWGVGAGAATLVLLWLASRGAFDDFLFMQRLANMAQEDDSSLTARGYFAFLEGNAIQLLFGLGMANVIDIAGREVHSTLGSMMNNYGLVGLGLFGGVLVIWARTLWINHGFIGLFCLAGPAMLYGITHNGTRFTIFWLLLAASLAMARRRERPVLRRHSPRLADDTGHEGARLSRRGENVPRTTGRNVQ